MGTLKVVEVVELTKDVELLLEHWLDIAPSARRILPSSFLCSRICLRVMVSRMKVARKMCTLPGLAPSRSDRVRRYEVESSPRFPAQPTRRGLGRVAPV